MNLWHKNPPYRFAREYNAKGEIVKTTTVWSKSFLRNRDKKYSARLNKIVLTPARTMLQ